MRSMQLARVDLNLLPALAALLEERSVTRAADVVGLSQSAMSRSLARLRRLLDDDLLVRTGDGYVLTATAEAVRRELGDVVPQLESMLLGRSFDPATQTRQFRLAGSDYAVSTFGVAVGSRVLAGAPSSSVRFLPWHQRIVHDLADGELDLVLSGMRLSRPVLSEPLFTDRVVCVVDRGHPLAGRSSITLEEYLAFGHVVIDIDNGSQPAIDGVLAMSGRHRTASVTLPFHVLAPLALVGTELIASLPSRVLQHVVTPLSDQVHVMPAPIEVDALPYFMSWHARADQDQGHRWLREQVRSAVAALHPADPEAF